MAGVPPATALTHGALLHFRAQSGMPPHEARRHFDMRCDVKGWAVLEAHRPIRLSRRRQHARCHDGLPMGDDRQPAPELIRTRVLANSMHIGNLHQIHFLDHHRADAWEVQDLAARGQVPMPVRGPSGEDVIDTWALL